MQIHINNIWLILSGVFRILLNSNAIRKHYLLTSSFTSLTAACVNRIILSYTFLNTLLLIPNLFFNQNIYIYILIYRVIIYHAKFINAKYFNTYLKNKELWWLSKHISRFIFKICTFSIYIILSNINWFIKLI